MLGVPETRSVRWGLRQHLRQALKLVPRDLLWFSRRCDGCYRVVWQAISRARLGLTGDAFAAWWLAEHRA